METMGEEKEPGHRTLVLSQAALAGFSSFLRGQLTWCSPGPRPLRTARRGTETATGMGIARNLALQRQQTACEMAHVWQTPPIGSVGPSQMHLQLLLTCSVYNATWSPNLPSSASRHTSYKPTVPLSPYARWPLAWQT